MEDQDACERLVKEYLEEQREKREEVEATKQKWAKTRADAQAKAAGVDADVGSEANLVAPGDVELTQFELEFIDQAANYGLEFVTPLVARALHASAKSKRLSEDEEKVRAEWALHAK